MDVVAIIGAGLIGRGWALLFAEAGFAVRLYDSAPGATAAGLDAIRDAAADMKAHGLIQDPAALTSRIHAAATLAEAVDGSMHVQEAVIEDAEAKRVLFDELDRMLPASVVLASSCSTIPPDRFLLTAKHPERCVVAHPFNPPNVVPLVEIVPSSSTSESTIERTTALMVKIGQEPIRISNPVVGYAVNRLQAVVIAEAISLVANNVVSPADLDKCMKFGLGRRWSFLGPFETMDLNAHHGFLDYVTRYEPIYRSMLDDIDTRAKWDADAVQRIEAWRRQEAPTSDAINRRRLWRDKTLARLTRFFREN